MKKRGVKIRTRGYDTSGLKGKKRASWKNMKTESKIAWLRLQVLILYIFLGLASFTSKINVFRKFSKNKLIKIELIFLVLTILFSLFGFILISYDGNVGNMITGFSSFEIFPQESFSPPIINEETNETFSLPIVEEPTITEGPNASFDILPIEESEPLVPTPPALSFNIENFEPISYCKEIENNNLLFKGKCIIQTSLDKLVPCYLQPDLTIKCNKIDKFSIQSELVDSLSAENKKLLEENKVLLNKLGEISELDLSKEQIINIDLSQNGEIKIGFGTNTFEVTDFFYGTGFNVSIDTNVTLTNNHTNQNISDMIVYYKFTDGAGDSSYSSWDLLNTNTTHVHEYYDFDGNDDWLYNTAFAYTFSEYTLAMWIKIDGAIGDSSAHWYPIDLTYGANNPTQGMYIDDGTGRFGCKATTGTDVAKWSGSTIAVNDSRWHHVACVVNASTLTGYIDGVQSNSRADLDGTLRPGTDICIGSGRCINYPNVGKNFGGSMDEITVWNISLTASEIANLYSDGLYHTDEDGASYIDGGVLDLDEWNRIRDIYWDCVNDSYSNCSLSYRTGNFTDKINLSDDGLVSYWNLSDAESSLEFMDSYEGTYPSGNNGTCSGAGCPNRTNGFFEGDAGMSFDGVNDYINASYSFDAMTTIAVWFYNESGWHHAVNVSGTTYYNGATGDTIIPVINMSGDVIIGMLDSSTYFNGTIDSVAVWNKSLTADEVLELYVSWSGWSSKYYFSPTTINTDNRTLQYRVYLESDNTTSNPYLTNVTLFYDNTAPTMGNMSIKPTTAYTNSTLNCTTYAYDLDLDTMSVNITWYNGSAAYESVLVSSVSNGSMVSDTLTAGIQFKDETWNCTAFANDAYEDSITNSTTKTITNTIPTVPTIGNPTNESRQTGNSVTLNCGSSTDPDEADTIKYEFYGDADTNPPTSLLQNATGTTYAWTTTDGRTYWWRCRANDAEDATSYTTTKQFVENNLSIVYNITIDPTVAYTNDTLNGSVMVMDSEDSVTVYMNWTNGTTYYSSCTETSVSSEEMESCSLTAGIQHREETWNFTSRIWDGYELSLFNSTSITISNLVPWIDTPTLEPATAYTGSILNCSTTVYDTDEGESLTINFTWYNGTAAYISKEITTTNGTYINYSLIEGIQAVGETWNCSVRVNDSGDDSAEWPSATKTISTTNPEVSLVSPTNESSSTTQLTTFTYNVTDIDGDTIDNCTLWIENSTGLAMGGIDSSVTIDQDETITATLPYETINWSVECIDDSNGKDNSTKFIYTVSKAVVEEAGGGVSGSSSGGGSSGSREKQSTTVFGTNIILPYLAPAPLIIIPNDLNLAIYEIIIEISKEAENVKIYIKEPVSIPIENPGLEVFRYTEINKENLPDSFISEVYIKFKVPKSIIKNKEVALYHYTDTWNKLQTKLIESDELFNSYEAISPGLSYFAITLRREKPLEKTVTAKAKEFVEEKITSFKKLSKKEIIYYGILPLLIICLLMGYGVYKLVKFFKKHKRIRNYSLTAIIIAVLFSVFVPLEKNILLFAVLPLVVIAIIVYLVTRFAVKKIKSKNKPKKKSKKSSYK